MLPRPRPHYDRQLGEQTARAAVLQRRYDRLALLRLLLFFGAVALLILAWSADWRLGLALLLLLLPAAYLGVRRHRAIARRAAHARERARLAAAELAALDHDFAQWADGAEFADPAHPYAADLDILGPHSLFQFTNRTVTRPGYERLAEQLLRPATEEGRGRRSQKIRELAARPDWCHDFRALGRTLADAPGQAERLRQWVARPRLVTGGYVRALRWLAPLLAVAGLAWCFLMSPWQLGLLAFLPAGLLLRRYAAPAAAEHAYTAAAGQLLSGYAELFAHLDHPAAPATRRLAYLVSQLDVRYNPFVVLLEITGLWSLQWLSRLDDWREAHRSDLPRWLDELAETDALVSWANLRFNHPDWAEATLTDAPRLAGTALAHPLLNPHGRVANDITMDTDGHIHLVTGSNMAGKSTWLRTVGINLVLARAGAPVCATALAAPPLDVWTSLRTQDNLHESTSAFYAELKRLRAVIGAVNERRGRVFFLLDEILKGTNSRDRHTGARALIRQLIRARGAGIIATHDLELAALADEPGSRVENFAMEVQTEGDRLLFDYRLRPGVSQSFNATRLMAQMGIDIDTFAP